MLDSILKRLTFLLKKKLFVVEEKISTIKHEYIAIDVDKYNRWKRKTDKKTERQRCLVATSIHHKNYSFLILTWNIGK